jgi:hypothetical protein
VLQSGLKSQKANYLHEFITHPVLGVVLNAYYADDPYNVGSSSQGGRGKVGSHVEARVLVVNDGTDCQWILPNVVVTPNSGSGYDDYAEELPHGTSKTIDGTALNLGQIDTVKLDGDWCIVDFVGGSIEQPFMVTWWPHPGNRVDPVTQNAAEQGGIEQGRRMVKRFQGTRFTVTSEGSVYLDTNEANTERDQGTREPQETGGDVRVNVKPERELEVNFNPSVFEVNPDGSPVEPDLLHGPQPVPKTRETDLTRLLFSKEFVRMVAGEIMELRAFQKLTLGDDTATENFVLGQQWKAMMSSVLDAIANHTHPTGVGPSGTLAPPQSVTIATKKNEVDNEDHLSDWIFGQKDVPTP